jgi:hypothetical protein
VVSVTDPYCRTLGFLDRSRYFFLSSSSSVVLTSQRTHGHILLFYLKLPNLEGQGPVFISPRKRVAQLYSSALGSLLSPLTTRRAAVEVF